MPPISGPANMQIQSLQVVTGWVWRDGFEPKALNINAVE
jgi:hypothetical protein